MTPQVKIMNALKVIVEGNGYEFIEKYEFSNLGSVYIQKPGNFASVLSFAFNFQPASANLLFYPVGVEPVGGCGTKQCCNHAYFNYIQGTKIEDMLDFVRQALPEIRKPRKSRTKFVGKDPLRKPINDLIIKYMEAAGTDFSGAVRDVMTELIKACGDEQVDASERFAAAFEVFDEEAELV